MSTVSDIKEIEARFTHRGRQVQLRASAKGWVQKIAVVVQKIAIGAKRNAMFLHLFLLTTGKKGAGDRFNTHREEKIAISFRAWGNTIRTSATFTKLFTDKVA